MIVETVKTYWKRFVGSVTNLRHKYWEDPFFKTEFNTIFLQVIFGVVLILVIGLYLNYFDDFRIFLGIISMMVLAFSLLVAKITLVPTREALKSQKRFISDVAHELRTPLSIIKTNSEVVLLEENIDPAVAETIKSNIDELNRISEIINNLLSLSKVIRPQDLHFRNIDLGLIIDNAVSKLKDLANSKSIQISIKKVSPHIVWGNGAALEQIVINLLKNALNYSPSGKQVWIETQPDYRGNIILTVKDGGVGIKKEDLIHIFEPFYRADRSRYRGLGSSGLGLTIVSELVRLHNGRITIKSAVGVGTTVIVLLPYGKSFSAFGSQESGSSEVSMDFLRR